MANTYRIHWTQYTFSVMASLLGSYISALLIAASVGLVSSASNSREAFRSKVDCSAAKGRACTHAHTAKYD